MSTASHTPASDPTAALLAQHFDALVWDFLDPSLTLRDMARKYAVPLLVLVRIGQNPQFRDTISEIVAAIKDRAHLLADAAIHSIVKAQRLAIDECTAFAEADPVTQDTDFTPEEFSRRARIHDQSRKSANLLLRTAKLTSPRSPMVPAESSSQSATATSAAAPHLPQSIPKAAAA